MDATSRAHCSLDVTVVTVVLALSADAMASTTRGARSFGTGCVREGRGGEASVSVSRLVGCVVDSRFAEGSQRRGVSGGAHRGMGLERRGEGRDPARMNATIR